MSKLFVDEIQPKTTGGVINAKGMILQVKQSILRDTWTGTSGLSAFEDTPLSVTITPQSTNSKILITGMINFNGGSGDHVDFKVVRNGADILLSTDSGLSNRTASHIHYFIGANDDIYQIQTAPLNLLDEPQSTSALTYTLQAGTPYNGAYLVYLNRTNTDTDASFNAYTVSTLTVMEIGG